jgi:GNAT superfamily N-acetyltransferase
VEAGTPRWLDNLPLGLRLAQPSDSERLFDICTAAYRENGFGGLDPAAVREVIRKGVNGENCVFGVIDGPLQIEAVLGMQPNKLWYGGDGDWYWAELLFYVRPEHRRSRHARRLFEFAGWWERHMQMPVVISVFPTEELELKEALFARHAKRTGSIWLFGDGVFRKQVKAA